MGVLDNLPQPELMAIGDSIYNGVRSLSINNELSQLSAPSLVAEGLGIRPRFACPDYGRPMLIDFEKYVHMLPDVGGIKADILDNFRYWLPAPPPRSGLPVFDNLSIASTVYRDLIERTAGKAEAELRAMNAGQIDDADGVIAQLADLYFALNTRFVLNPRGLDELMDKTAVEVAAIRKPKVLLVNIGSNDGLYSMAFDARADVRYANARPALQDLVDALAGLPAEIEIYFNGLVLPSTVSNLMPVDYYATNNRPPAGGYYAEYENAFSTGSYGTIDAAQMAALDRDVAEHNAFTVDYIASKNQARFHFVDVAAVLQRLNAKHEPDTPSNGLRMADRKRFTNTILEAAPFPFPAFRSGGLQSLDGMHLSTLGYGVLAQSVLDAMGSGRRLNLEGVYQRDTLLQQMPRIWSVVLWLWLDIRRARLLDQADPAAAGHEEAAVADLMDAAARFKIG